MRTARDVEQVFPTATDEVITSERALVVDGFSFRHRSAAFKRSRFSFLLPHRKCIHFGETLEKARGELADGAV